MSKAGLFSSVTVPMGGSGASSFDIILEKCHELVSDRVSDALTKMFDEADEALTALGSQSRDPQMSKLYEVTRNKVISQREAIVKQFRMRFLREFQERGNRVKKIGDQFAEVDLSAFEPVAEDDLNASPKFNALASKLRQYCDEELLALDQRVGVLIGDADLQSEDNPFTPQAIVDAYKHTCRQIDSNVDVQMVLLKLFDDYVLDEIRGVYRAVNKLLIENSILPKIRLSVARGNDGVKTQSAEPRPVERATGNKSDTTVMASIPEELTNTNLGGGMQRMDTMTLDVMAMLFDDLFDDRKIPTAVKALIGRLQTPLLKLAITDTSFFSRKSHPARRLLDELSEFSARLPVDIGASDPVYRKLESMLDSLIEEFEDDVKIFDDMRRQLDTLIFEMNGRADQKTRSIVRKVEQEEKLALAKTVAQEEIKVRVRAHAAPQLIVKFLAQQWFRLLVVMHVKEGEESESWKNALRTVDLLLWSGERKKTADERRKVVAVLPKLLKSLADGLAYAGIDDEIRAQFFSDLRKLHATNIDGPEQPSVTASGKVSVGEGGSEVAGTKVASGKPETVDKTETSDTVPDPEDDTSIAEPDEAESSDETEQTVALPMRDKPAKADTGQEMRLDFLPSGRGSEEAGTDVASEKPKTGEETEASNAVPDSEPVASITEIDEAETSNKAEQSGALPTQGKPAKADIRQEMRLDFLPSGGKTAAIPERADAAMAKTAISGQKSPTTDSLSASLKQESVPKKAAVQDAAPDGAGPVADSLPPLEFDAELPNPGEQGVAPADTASGAQSRRRSLELAAAPDQSGSPPPAKPKVNETANRMLSKAPARDPADSPTRTYKEPSAQLLAEMDKAMEATRTLFSDVDRFLILGQVQNAISLLDHRINRAPTDRESWVKLMAVYRDEGMDDDFERAYAAFHKQFGESSGS